MNEITIARKHAKKKFILCVLEVKFKIKKVYSLFLVFFIFIFMGLDLFEFIIGEIIYLKKKNKKSREPLLKG